MPKNRRLAAIMFTDMVGFTAATQLDERATLALRKEQESILRGLLAEYQGRRVKSTGDGLLVEFSSALKATECAVGIQRRLHERNGRSGVSPINLRIGIHLGDVEQQGSDIFGDAVNIASRIEPVADPGGVCVSGAVYDQIRGKIPEKLEKLPSRTLKGLQVPLDLYKVQLPWNSREPSPSRLGPPRLAVLPFSNISPDPKDEYFADGLTEELITVLSRLRGLRVIARTSVNLYKSTPKSVSQIGAELAVDAVLEGSVRKAGDQLRITVQLIDVATQEHTWASAYDRRLDNVFAVQTEIAEHTATALQLELLAHERDSISKVPTSNLAAYNLYLRGLYAARQFGYRGGEEAIPLLEEAIRSDPGFSEPYAQLANVLMGFAGETLRPREAFPRAKDLIQQCLALDANSSEGHTARGNLALQYEHDWVLAESEFHLALSLNPSSATAHRWYARLLEALQRFDEAARELKTAIELDPLWEFPQWRLQIVKRRLGDFTSPVAHAEAARDRNPQDPWSHLRLSFAYLYAGRSADAKTEAEFPFSAENEDAKVNQAILWALLGKKQEARQFLRELEEASASRYVSPESLAELHLALGEKERALELLTGNDGEGADQLWAWYQSSVYDPIRDDPTFQSLLRRLKLPTEVRWARNVGTSE